MTTKLKPSPKRQAKYDAAQALAQANAIRLRDGASVRRYIAPRNVGRLTGNRATRQRRQAGFQAMAQARRKPIFTHPEARP